MTLTIDGKQFELRDEGPCAKALHVDGVRVPSLMLNFAPESRGGARAGGSPTEREQRLYLKTAAQHIAANPNLLEVQ